MISRSGLVGILPAVAILALATLSVASAQDVMQLDLAFKNGQLPTSARQEKAAEILQPDLSKPAIKTVRGRPKRHRR